MEERGPKPEWKASQSAPLPNTGSKGTDFHDRAKRSKEDRFPLGAIIVAVIILSIIGLVLIFKD